MPVEQFPLAFDELVDAQRSSWAYIILFFVVVFLLSIEWLN